MLGYTFRGSSYLYRENEVQAQLRYRLQGRPRGWMVWLVTRRLSDGKLLAKGPKRPPQEAPAPFAGTITSTGTVNKFFRVRGKVRVLTRINVVAAWAGNFVVQSARKEIGTRYRFGAQNGPDDAGPDSFDCSGYTAEFWQEEGGVNLVHSARGQQQQCKSITLGEAREGCLVFCWFKNSRGIQWPNASHVGFYLSTVRDNRGRPIAVEMLDTRNPVNEPVAVRIQSLGSVVGFGDPTR